MRTVLLIALLLALPATAADLRPVAMVTDLVGKATLEREPVAALRIQSLLREGDRIRLASGAWARLVFMEGGRLERLSGPCLLRVEAGGARVLEGPATAVRVERTPVRPALVPGRNLDRMAGYATRGVVEPTMDPVVEGTPRFTWQSVLPGPFEVMVTKRGHLVWSGRTADRALEYSGPPLEQDVTYDWYVSVSDEGGGQGIFRIVSGETRQRLKEADRQAREMLQADPDDPTPAVLVMTLYTESLLWQPAEEWAREAVRRRPEDPDLRATLAELLHALGRHDEARVESDRAWELRPRP